MAKLFFFLLFFFLCLPFSFSIMFLTSCNPWLRILTYLKSLKLPSKRLFRINAKDASVNTASDPVKFSFAKKLSNDSKSPLRTFQILRTNAELAFSINSGACCTIYKKNEKKVSCELGRNN